MLRSSDELGRAALLLVALCPLQATGQDGSTQIDEIIVTAEAREERVQDVPVAIKAFSSRDIVEAGIETTEDFVNLVPNVSLDDSFTLGNTFIQVRGVSQINNADSPVSIVIDGVPQNNQKQLKQELFDIERIEVLKGPQGALYGRNAIGGAINIVSKMPGDEFEGKVKIGAGDGGLFKASAAVGGPIVEDKLLFRVAAAYREFDGVVTNVFLGEEVDFAKSTDARARLIWLASDTLTVDARLAYSDADGECCRDSWLPSGGGANPLANTFFEPNMNIRGETTDKEILEGTLKVDWDASFGRITSITAYTDVQEAYFGDLDFTQGIDTSFSSLFGTGVGQQQDLKVDMLSQELRVTSPDEQKLRWLVGAYYLRTDRQLDTVVSLDIPGTTPVRSSDGFIPVINISEDNDNTAWALFGQAEYDINDRLELVLGLRYDRDKRDHTGLLPINTSARKTYKDLQPRVVLNQRWNDDLLTYVSYSRGFRSGGFNAPSVASSEFEEETLDNFEVGLKSTWLDRRVLFNAAAFYARDDNFQFFFFDALAGAQIIDNIDEVDIVGADIELQAVLAPDWTVYAALGVTDTEIKASSKRPQDVGNHTPKSQSYGFNLGSQYRLRTDSGIENVFRIDYERRGRKYWHSNNLNSMDPFGLLNLRWTVNINSLSLSLWGNNVTDEQYWHDYNSTDFSGLPGIDIGFLSRGRTWGADLVYRF